MLQFLSLSKRKFLWVFYGHFSKQISYYYIGCDNTCRSNFGCRSKFGDRSERKTKCYITLNLYGQYMFVLQCGECQNWKHGLQFLD
jgi:hypothetical protein